MSLPHSKLQQIPNEITDFRSGFVDTQIKPEVEQIKKALSENTAEGGEGPVAQGSTGGPSLMEEAGV